MKKRETATLSLPRRDETVEPVISPFYAHFGRLRTMTESHGIVLVTVTMQSWILQVGVHA